MTDLAITPLVGLALTTGMQTHASDLPSLRWRVDYTGTVVGQASAGDYATEDIPTVLRTWAEHFGLDTDDEPVPGTLSYSGEDRCVRLTVWGITDWAKFENRSRS